MEGGAFVDQTPPTNLREGEARGNPKDSRLQFKCLQNWLWRNLFCLTYLLWEFQGTSFLVCFLNGAKCILG